MLIYLSDLWLGAMSPPQRCQFSCASWMDNLDPFSSTILS
jgi:hypothetical protein